MNRDPLRKTFNLPYKSNRQDKQWNETTKKKLFSRLPQLHPFMFTETVFILTPGITFQTSDLNIDQSEIDWLTFCNILLIIQLKRSANPL